MKSPKKHVLKHNFTRPFTNMGKIWGHHKCDSVSSTTNGKTSSPNLCRMSQNEPVVAKLWFSGILFGKSRLSPHVDVEGLVLVDLEASGPGAVGRVHQSHAQQLVVVVARPVEDRAGARQGWDVALWIGCALESTQPVIENKGNNQAFLTL